MPLSIQPYELSHAALFGDIWSPAASHLPHIRFDSLPNRSRRKRSSKMRLNISDKTVSADCWRPFRPTFIQPFYSTASAAAVSL